MLVLFERLSKKVFNNKTATITIWLLVSQLIAAAVSFIVNILAAYGLTPEHRGLLAFYLQIGYLLTTFMLLGAEKPFIARIKGRFVTSAALLLKIVKPAYVLVLAILITAGILYFNGLSSVAAPVGLLAVYVVCNQHLRLIRAAFISSGYLKPFMTVTVVTNVLTLGLAIVLALLRYDNYLLWLLAYVVANFLASFYVARAVRASRHDMRRNKEDVVREVRRQGLMLLPASLGNIAMFRPERLLLPILAGPAELGIYIVVAGALEVAVWPVQQWADSKMRDWQGAQYRIDRRFRWSALWRAGLGVLVISIFLIIILLVVVLWVLPGEYQSSLNLIIPLTIANIIYGVTRVQHGMAIVKNRSGLVSVAEIATLLVSFALYFALIPSFGALGAALCSVVGNTVSLMVTEIGLSFSNKKTQ